MENLIKPATSKPRKQSETLHDKARFFITLRWIAIVVALVVSYVSTRVVHILPASNFQPLVITFASLSAWNLLFLLLLKNHTTTFRKQMLLQVVIDLLVITTALHYSGGVENHLFILYVLHLIIASTLLNQQDAYIIAVLSCLLFTGLVTGEYMGLLSHYPLGNYDGDTLLRGTGIHPADHRLFFVGGISAVFCVLAFLVTYLSTKTIEHLRSSEKEARKKAEELASETEKMETILDGSGMGYMLFDEDLHLQEWDERVEEWFSPKLKIGQPSPFVHGEKFRSDLTSGFYASEQAESSGREEQLEYLIQTENRNSSAPRIIREKQCRTADGDERYFEFMTYPMYDDEQNLVQVVELVNDVTNQKLLKQKAQHEDRMAKLGQMASGIAHELGNPLSSIRARLQRLKRKYDESFIQETAEFIDTEIGRLNRLIRDISSFARAPEPETEQCRIQNMLEETVNLLSLDPRSSDISIERQFGEHLTPFYASRDQLSQVFLNLGINALDAMQEEEEGRLEITAEQTDSEVIISFSDTGEGIPEDMKYDIFTPYFSTKDRDEGTGLGLSIAHSLVEAHDGTIEVESEPGKGTTFTVRIPFIKNKETAEQIFQTE